MKIDKKTERVRNDSSLQIRDPEKTSLCNSACHWLVLVGLRDWVTLKSWRTREFFAPVCHCDEFPRARSAHLNLNLLTIFLHDLNTPTCDYQGCSSHSSSSPCSYSWGLGFMASCSCFSSTKGLRSRNKKLSKPTRMTKQTM